MKNGNIVEYIRPDSISWHGPAVVLGQDGQCVLVLHGGKPLRVHPCRLRLRNSLKNTENTTSSVTELKAKIKDKL